MKHFDEEEAFHARDRKQFRKERRMAEKTDRSKFKKTDAEPEKSEEELSDLPRGRVIAITGEGSWVDYEGKQYLCALKGFLKKEKTQAKNLLAVGDWVRFSKEGSIVQIEERTSSLSRTDISGRKEQLIAVNIDLAIIVVSVALPELKPALVDRYMIAAEKGNLQPIIVLSKIDLLETKELYDQFLKDYEPLGYPIISVSTVSGVGIAELRALLQNKTSVFSGQSGVGKSSLLNACFGLTLKVGELTQKTYKGTHTTTTAELLPLPGGGYCVDTPGIRSFGIWKLKKEEVVTHFIEFVELSHLCKFPDCTHITEPQCEVLRRLEEGKLSHLRYESYKTLLTEAMNGPEKTTWS